MSTFKARGIVIKQYKTGESDKILTMLCKEYGKIVVFSKGAQNPKSKFLVGAQIFSYSDFVIFNKGNFKTTSQIDLIESFYAIRSDYNKLCYASYFLELTDKFILEDMPVDDILLLLIKTFSVMTKNIIDDKLIYIIFNFKFLQLNGSSPMLDYCTKCGNKLFSAVYFSHTGAVCQKCRNNDLLLSDSSIYTINHILNSNINNLYNFTVTDTILNELTIVFNLFFKYNFDIKLKTLDFIPSI